MELLKLDDRPAEFKIGDVTIYYRTMVSVGDRHSVINAGTTYEGDRIGFRPWELYSKLIQVFVTGWQGVTENGKPVTYSYDTLMNRLPADMTKDIVTSLGLEIAKKNGFVPDDKTEQVADLKNG